MASTDTSPLVLHDRRRSAARLRAGVLLLDAGGAGYPWRRSNAWTRPVPGGAD
ncbi:hypothetical protein ABZY09_13465 [Streptomyces sp. NPDC002928]|uniref:hypothetical protein n=1 Tax=Streptomyces sp. NPDC002928 TaxID=3154440 RepID=UPI0033AD64C5